jgi:hypothetical protein
MQNVRVLVPPCASSRQHPGISQILWRFMVHFGCELGLPPHAQHCRLTAAALCEVDSITWPAKSEAKGDDAFCKLQYYMHQCQ